MSEKMGTHLFIVKVKDLKICVTDQLQLQMSVTAGVD